MVLSHRSESLCAGGAANVARNLVALGAEVTWIGAVGADASGREVLRLLDSCQLTASKKVATPGNWKQGEDVIILPAVSDEAARETYPDGWQQPLPYIRIVPQPK